MNYLVHLLLPGESTSILVGNFIGDLVRGNHQGQRQLPRDQQAGHKTVPDQGMPKRQKALATQEPSTQDVSLEA